MKNKFIAAVLAFLVGVAGIHRFYLNENEAGKKYLIWFIVGILTSWFLLGLIPLIALSIIAFVDCCRYLFMSDEEFDAKYNEVPVKEELSQTNKTIILMKNYILGDLFKLEPRDNDELRFFNNIQEACRAGLESMELMDNPDVVKTYNPGNSVPYVMNGKKYQFYGYTFMDDGVERRRFFLFE